MALNSLFCADVPLSNNSLPLLVCDLLPGDRQKYIVPTGTLVLALVSLNTTGKNFVPKFSTR